MKFALKILVSGIWLSRAFGGEALPSPAQGKEWKLVWSDEFEGGAIDRTKWDFEQGNGFVAADVNQYIAGWGNNELQYYTDRPENAQVASGMLHIRALAEPYEGRLFTSARLRTKGRFAKTYGRFEMRARLPAGKGLWPAFWLMPQAETYGGWAASGEIDIMEARGREPGKILGTIHFGGHWPQNTHKGGEFSFPKGESSGDFHVYAVEWEPGVIRWYVDDHLYFTETRWWSSRQGAPGGMEGKTTDSWPAPFDKPFYIILNLAVGGDFGGNPDASTKFPAEMTVDYIRVYDRAAGYAPAAPSPP